jgi:hypothetical protein
LGKENAVLSAAEASRVPVLIVFNGLIAIAREMPRLRSA